MNTTFKVLGGIGALALLGFGLLLGMVLQVAGTAQAGSGENTCQASLTPATQTVALENICLADGGVGAQVVAWAKKMADALTVNPACGSSRTPPACDAYTYYTSAFPQEVIRYGQEWCQVHGGCDVWSNGNYQCVSFVRGAYSQVYPMNITGNAFDLWGLYRHQIGWQEIPSAAGAVSERSLPQPGDVMVFKDQGVGHVAIVISVIAPYGGKNGEVDFANANSTSPYDHMPLLPNLLVDTSAWNQAGALGKRNTYTVWGYLRPRLNASSALTRISQLDPAQYTSASEFNTWAYSACSTAAMTEVLGAYGLHLRIQDVLNVERSLMVPGSSPPEPDITPQLGLTAEVGIAATMQQFGFKTTWGDHWTLDQVLSAANSGTPVIVSWPPDRYDGGHIVVVLGGDNRSIRLADSSSWNRHVLSATQFMQWWGGFAAVSTPANAAMSALS